MASGCYGIPKGQEAVHFKLHVLNLKYSMCLHLEATMVVPKYALAIVTGSSALQVPVREIQACEGDESERMYVDRHRRSIASRGFMLSLLAPGRCLTAVCLHFIV